MKTEETTCDSHKNSKDIPDVKGIKQITNLDSQQISKTSASYNKAMEVEQNAPTMDSQSESNSYAESKSSPKTTTTITANPIITTSPPTTQHSQPPIITHTTPTDNHFSDPPPNTTTNQATDDQKSPTVVTSLVHPDIQDRVNKAANVTLDAHGKPIFRPKSPATGRPTSAGKMLTRKCTPAQLPKLAKLNGKYIIQSYFCYD